MHKLLDVICDEMDELERKAGKDGKLSMAELQYVDMLAHTKKNLLKADEMMEGGMSSYDSSRGSYRDGRSSYESSREGRSSYESSNRRGGGGRGRGRSSYYDGGGSSYAEDVQSLADSVRSMMNDLPESAKAEARRFVQKLDQM